MKEQDEQFEPAGKQLRQSKQKQKKKSKGGKFLIAVLITAVLGAVAGTVYISSVNGKGKLYGYLKNLQPKNSQSSQQKNDAEVPEKTKSDTTVDDHIKSENENSMVTDGTTYFCTYGKRFLMCTKDGVRFYNTMGEQKWNDTFSMASPMLVKEGDYCAVGDMAGKSVYVYSESGKLYSIQTEGTVTHLALNTNGYLIVISNLSDNSYSVQVYNESGTIITERKEVTTGVYPLSADISNDNAVFAVSYLDTSDVKIAGRILLFYTDPNVGKEFEDSMFAAKNKEGQVIPIISFLHNGILGAVSDENIFGIDAGGQELWNYELTNRLDYVNLENGKYIVAALGEELSGKDGEDKGTVIWIDGEGKKSTSFSVDNRVTYLKNADESMIIGSGSHFYCVKHNGKMVWEHAAAGEVSDILLMGNETQALYVTRNKAAIVDMTKVNNSVGNIEETIDENENDTVNNTSTEENTPETNITEKGSSEENTSDETNDSQPSA